VEGKVVWIQISGPPGHDIILVPSWIQYYKGASFIHSITESQHGRG